MDIEIVKKRDKIQHRIISALASEKFQPFIFKGGTMLRVCGIPNYRNSEDLDFDMLPGFYPYHLFEILKKHLKLMSKDIGEMLDIQTSIETEFPHIKWGEGLSNEEFIKLEVGIASNLTKYMEPQSIQPNHSEINTGEQINCYSLEHVAATKNNCLSSRIKGRDIYDTWYLSELHDTLEEGWNIYLSDESLQATLPPEEIAQEVYDKSEAFALEWENDVNIFLIPEGFVASDVIEEVVHRLEELPGMNPVRR